MMHFDNLQVIWKIRKLNCNWEFNEDVFQNKTKNEEKFDMIGKQYMSDKKLQNTVSPENKKAESTCA